VVRDEDLDASREAGLASNEAVALEAKDHLMNRRRCDAEMALHVGFGGRLAEHAGIASCNNLRNQPASAFST
jgi:hypothetical protein